MKKRFIVFFFILSISFVLFVSFAGGYGTNIEYIGNASEEYTVTVPAKIRPNGYGNVIVEGEWASNRIVRVGADETVEIVNNINIFNKQTLDISFLGINANGNDLQSQKLEEMILVGELKSKILFGEWSGTFDYSVEIIDDPYSEGFYGRTYTRTFLNDLAQGVPLEIVAYKDKSATFVFDDGRIFTTEPDSLIIENEYMYYNDRTYIMSEDKTKFTLVNNNIELAAWELRQTDNVIDNTLPINLKLNNLYNNTFF